MAGSTDTRIVQMQFNNRDFERNIKTSEKTLDRFKKELDFNKCIRSFDSFVDATKRLTFDAMADNLQKLTDKFTGLGDIGEMVLSQIRGKIESVVSKISGLIDSLGLQQITAGLEKFGEMNKNVQTIMAATGKSEEEVAAVMKRLNAYTDMTSYNFTDMAANIGKFTSVGIPLEQAEMQMEGIANWAARSGAGIQEASRAMYNLSQAMGVGKMTKIDWKSIENAGMATKEFKEQMIAAAVASGTLVAETGKNGQTIYKTAKHLGKQVEVNYQNVSDTLAKGWANSQVIQKTLMEYYYNDLTGEGEAVIELTKEQLEKTKALFEDDKLTQKEWKTLESMGLADNKVKEAALKAAVAQGKLVEAGEKGGKKLYAAVDETGKQIEFTMDEIDESLKLGWFDKSVAKDVGLLDNLGRASYLAAQRCTTLTDVLNAWKDMISTGWMKSWQMVFGGLAESMDLFTAICNKVGDSFTNMIASLVGGTDANGETITGILQYWAETLGGRNNLWSMFVGEYDDLYKGAYGILDVIHDIGDMIGNAFVEVMSIFVGDDRKALFKTDKNARNAWIAIQLNNTIESIKNFIKSIKDFFEAVPEGGTESRFSSIQKIVQGIFSIFVIGYTIIRDLVNFFIGVGEQLGDSFDTILQLFGLFGTGLQNTAETAVKGGGLKVVLDDILEIIRPLTSAINGFIGCIATLIASFIQSGEAGQVGTNAFETIGNAIKNVFKLITRIGVPILGFLGKFFRAFSDLRKNNFSPEALQGFSDKIKTAFKEMLDNIFSFIPNFSSQVKGIWTAFKELFTSGFSDESVVNFKDKIKKFIDPIFNLLPQNIKDKITELWNKIAPAFKTIGNLIKNVFKVITRVGMPVLRFFGDFFKAFSDLRKNNFSPDALQTFGEKIKTAFKTMLDSIFSFIPDFSAKISGIWASIKELFTSGFSDESVSDFKNKLKSFIEPIFNLLPQNVQDKVKELWNKVAPTLRTFGGLLKNVFKVITRVGMPILGFVGDFLKAFGDLSKDNFSPDAVKTFGEKMKTAFKKMLDGIFYFIPDFTTKISDLWASIKELFTSGFSAESWEKLKNKFGVIFGDIKKAIPAGIKTTAKTIIDSIKAKALEIWNTIKDLFKSVGKVFTSGFSSESISELKGKLKGIFGPILDLIPQEFKDKIKGLWNKFTMPLRTLWAEVKLIFEAIKNVFSSKFSKESINNLKGLFGKFWKSISDMIPQGVKDGIKNLINKVTAPLKKVFDAIQKVFVKLFGFKDTGLESDINGEGNTFLGVIKQWFNKIFGGLGDFLKTAKNEFSNVNLFTLIKEQLGIGLLAKFMGGLVSIVKGTNMYAIIMSFLGGYALIKLIKMFKQGGGLFGEIKGFFQSAKDALKEGIKFKSDNQVETLGDKILKIAKGIALLVAAVVVLGNMDINSLIKGGIALAAIMVAFTGLLFILKKYIATDFKQTVSLIGVIGAMGLAITGIVLAISLLMATIKSYAKMDWGDLAKPLTALVVVLATLIGFGYALKALKISSVKVAGIASLALGIGVLILALTPLSKMDWGKLAKIGIGLVVFLGIIVLFTKLMSGLTMAGTGMFQIALLAIGIAIMVKAFSGLANFSWEQLEKVGISLVAFLGSILVFILLLNAGGGSMYKKGMMNLVLVAAAIFILIESLKPLASMNWEGLGKMGVSLAAILLLLALFTNTSASMKKTGMMNMIFVAGSIWLLLEALKPLASYGWEDLAKMGVSLVVLGGVIAAMTHLIKPMSAVAGKSVLLMMAGLALVFAAFALVMLTIKDVSWEQILACCLGLAAVLVVFSVILKKLKKVGNISKAAGMLVALVGLAAVMLAFSLSLAMIKDIPVEKVVGFAAGLSVLLVALAATINILKSVSILGALKAIAIIGAALIALAAVLSVAIPLLLNALGSSFQSFAAKMSLMAGMFLDFTTMMNEIKMEDIQAAKVKIEAIMEIIRSLKDAGDYLDAIHVFSECMLLLGSGVSQFMFSTSDVNGNPDDMPALKLIQTLISMKDQFRDFSIGNVADEFHMLGTGLSLFQTATQDITNGDNLPALKMAQAIINMQSGLQNFTAGNSAMEFFTLGVGLSLFDTATESISITNPDEMPAIKMAQAIINMQSGLQNFTAGNSAMEFFGLGVGLSLFNTATSSISISNPDDMPALKMASAILNLQSSLSSFSVGDSMSQFFRLGVGLRSFNASVSDITTGEPVAFQLLKNLADQADNLTKLTQLPLETFKSQLSGLGGALSIYAEGVQAATGLDLGKNGEAPDVSSAIELLHALTDGIANDEKGFQIPDIPDKDAMAGFGADLAALATALKQFSDAAKDMNPLSNLLALGCLDFMAKLKERLTEDNLKVTKAFTDNGIYNVSVLESFGTDLIALGVALKDFSTNTADFKKNDGALDTLDFLADIRGKLQQQDIEATKIFSSNGIYSETPLKQFGLDLAALGTSLADYNKSTKDFEKNDGAIKTLEFLTSIRGKLESQDILATKIFSDNGINSEGPLKQFGLDLAALGTSLSDYNTSTAEFKKNDSALEVLTFLADLRGQLTEDNINTVNAFTNAGITSVKPLKDFGIDLAALGISLGNFNTKVKDFSVSRNVYSALSFFKNLKDELTTTTLQNAFIFDKAGVHKETLSSFGTDISALGEALGGFATNVNFDESKSANFDQAISALDKLKDISNRLPYIGGIKALWEGNKQTLSDVAAHVKSVGESFAQMTTDLSGDAEKGIKSFDVELVGSAFDMLQKVGDLIATLAIKDPTAVMANDASGYLSTIDNMLMLMTNGLFATGEKAIIPKLVTFMDQYREATKAVGGFGEKDLSIFEAVRKMLESLQLLMSIDPSYDFSKLGESMSKGIKDGITGFSDPVTDAIKTLISNTLASADIAMTSPESGLTPKQIGLNIVTGLKNGLTDAPSVQEVIDAAVDLIRKAKEAAQKEAAVQSPSKVFEQIGAYISQGLAIGIDKGSDDASKSGSDMVGNIVDNADRALANLSYLIANGVDANPTITPVLDLSNVRAGMAELNSGFGDRRIGLDTSGIARRANASAWNLNAHPETVVQNGTDLSGVYERMSTLGNQIIEMGNKIGKMQLVLDTGAVAGGVINDIDSSLGRRTFYAGRRN